ncbi:NUDIX hydrolase [Metabacillus sp. RGM 3146]|uniref:NUDIX hydrolase n=1 Tax=Metabacillus sp. RGM 3146 TaxID=3401092 RepID=UPI003B9C35B3
MSHKWLEWAKQIQSLSQAGLAYSKDVYDLERFELLRRISMEIMTEYTDTTFETVKELFANETGYQTPKVDVRGVIFKNSQILMVKEATDGLWSLPGGFGDIGLSPAEVAVKEVREETGFEAETVRLLAVLDKKNYNHPPSPYHIYKLFILCSITGGQAATGIETEDVRFFSENELPPLSTGRITEEQIKLMFQFYHHPEKETVFD